MENIKFEGKFAIELEERMGDYFVFQKRLSTIVKRSVAWSLIDFPILMANWPFIIGNWFFRILAFLSPSSERHKKYAKWCRDRRSRSGRFGRLLPPYPTKSAQSKLKDFKHMVIAPLEEKYPSEVRAMDFNRMEETLIKTLTGWEKVPNLLESVLTPICWLQGITFLGLDPKTVFLKSRDKRLWHLWEALGQNFVGKIYLRIKWLFVDTVPWSYTAKFIAIGLLAYIVIIVIIEFISVQILYREGVVKRLLLESALITPTHD